jgi:3-oxoacyl-[acyl-carrier-protein] synthase II
MKKVVQECLEKGGDRGRTPDLISLSANFSLELDPLEFQILTDLLGDALARIPLTPLKYFAGEYAGSGALRLAMLLLSIRDQVVPPSINPEELIPGTPWNRRFIPSRPGKVERCLMTGFTFGGGNACLAVRKA